MKCIRVCRFIFLSTDLISEAMIRMLKLGFESLYLYIMYISCSNDSL